MNLIDGMEPNAKLDSVSTRTFQSDISAWMWIFATIPVVLIIISAMTPWFAIGGYETITIGIFSEELSKHEGLLGGLNSHIAIKAYILFCIFTLTNLGILWCIRLGVSTKRYSLLFVASGLVIWCALYLILFVLLYLFFLIQRLGFAAFYVDYVFGPYLCVLAAVSVIGYIVSLIVYRKELEPSDGVNFKFFMIATPMLILLLSFILVSTTQDLDIAHHLPGPIYIFETRDSLNWIGVLIGSPLWVIELTIGSMVISTIYENTYEPVLISHAIVSALGIVWILLIFKRSYDLGKLKLCIQTQWFMVVVVIYSVLIFQGLIDYWDNNYWYVILSILGIPMMLWGIFKLEILELMFPENETVFGHRHVSHLDRHLLEVDRYDRQSSETITIKGAAKRCPYCAETIEYEAIECRYCGSDLEAKDELSLDETDDMPAERIEFSGSICSIYSLKNEGIIRGDDTIRYRFTLSDWEFRSLKPNLWLKVRFDVNDGRAVNVRPLGMRLCPYCAEIIPPQATKCPYCRSELSTEVSA